MNIQNALCTTGNYCTLSFCNATILSLKKSQIIQAAHAVQSQQIKKKKQSDCFKMQFTPNHTISIYFHFCFIKIISIQEGHENSTFSMVIYR